jgi:hypothetical protein
MSNNPSQDPIPYRKDLRKKMDLEGKGSENGDSQEESKTNRQGS